MNSIAASRWQAALGVGRRVRWLFAIAGSLLCIELMLRGWESFQQVRSELESVQHRVRLLQASDDGVDWPARIKAAEQQSMMLERRLWEVPSEAQAQARLRDWLTNAMRTAAVSKPSVTLLPVQSASAASAAGPSTLVRVRAAVSFELSPNVLESVLLQVEAGEQLARVDSLSASARSRRVEMTVSVPVRLVRESSP